MGGMALGAQGPERAQRVELSCRCSSGVSVGEGGDGVGVGAVFDRGVLDDLAAALDESELDAYLALLESTILPRVAQMLRHVAVGEVEGLLESAHALTGGAGCYGLVALSAAARAVEADARAVRLDALKEAVAEVAALVEVSLTAVARWREAGKEQAAKGVVVSP